MARKEVELSPRPVKAPSSIFHWPVACSQCAMLSFASSRFLPGPNIAGVCLAKSAGLAFSFETPGLGAAASPSNFTSITLLTARVTLAL